MAYVKVTPPSVVYHLTRMENLDSILDDGKISRFLDSECWFCESLGKMKAYMEQTVMCEGKPYATVVNLCEGCGTYTRYYFNTTSGKLTIGGTLNSSGDENNKSRNAKIELYEVNKSGAIDSYTVSQFTESTSLSHTFRNLSANKNYYIRIVNTTGWGGPFTDLWLGGTVSISQ